MTQAYRTAAAFKQALEQRLCAASTSGVDFARRRQLVVFDRFLARVALELGEQKPGTVRIGTVADTRRRRGGGSQRPLRAKPAPSEAPRAVLGRWRRTRACHA